LDRNILKISRICVEMFSDFELKIRLETTNEVLTYQRRLLRGRQSFANGHQKHRHGEKGRDAKGDFFPRLGGHVEHQQSWRTNRRSIRESFTLIAKY